jgi:hypothetical protein
MAWAEAWWRPAQNAASASDRECNAQDIGLMIFILYVPAFAGEDEDNDGNCAGEISPGVRH